jgi:hypothetical protein
MSLKVSARLVQAFEILRVYGVLRLSFCETNFESKIGATTSALPIIRLGKARGFSQGVLLQARVVGNTRHIPSGTPRVFSREPPSQSIIAPEFRIERKSFQGQNGIRIVQFVSYLTTPSAFLLTRQGAQLDCSLIPWSLRTLRTGMKHRVSGLHHLFHPLGANIHFQC